MTTPAATADAAPAPADQAAQPDAAAPEATAQPAANPPASGDADDAADSDSDDGQDDDADDDGPEKSRAARQAASYRRQLRESQDSLVAATAALGVQQWAIVEAAAVAAGFDPKLRNLIESSGVELASLVNDSGLVDAGKVAACIRDTASAFNVRPNPPKPQPTPGQGQGVGPGPKPGWNTLISDAARGQR